MLIPASKFLARSVRKGQPAIWCAVSTAGMVAAAADSAEDKKIALGIAIDCSRTPLEQAWELAEWATLLANRRRADVAVWLQYVSAPFVSGLAEHAKLWAITPLQRHALPPDTPHEVIAPLGTEAPVGTVAYWLFDPVSERLPLPAILSTTLHGYRKLNSSPIPAKYSILVEDDLAQAYAGGSRTALRDRESYDAAAVEARAAGAVSKTLDLYFRKP